MLCRCWFTIIILWNAGRTVRQATTLQFGRYFPLVSDKKRRRFFAVLILWSAPRPPKTLRCLTPAKLSRWWTRAIRARTRGAVFAGNEYALFFANCPRVFIEVLVLFPSFALFAQLVLFVAFCLLPRLRGAAPQTPRKPAGARLDRAL